MASHEMPGLFDAELQEAIRGRFLHVAADPVGGPRIYLENAGGSLTLSMAAKAAAAASELPDNAGRDNPASRHVVELIDAGTADVRVLLGVNDGVVVSGESTTANVFRVMDAVTQGRQGNIVTTELEHPCMLSAAKYYASRRGLECRIVPVAPPTGEVSAEAVAAHVDGDTVAVGFIHASNIIGTRTDAAAIARVIRQLAPEAIILLDGTQHAPHGPIDAAALGVDAYFFAPYKMFSVVGTCFAWLSPRASSLDHPRLAGAAEQNWQLGTRNPAAFAAWSAVIDYLVWLGERVNSGAVARREQVVAAMRAIEAHETALTRHMLNGLSMIAGARVHGHPIAGPQREAVFAFSIEGRDMEDIVRNCVQRGVVVNDRRHDAYSGTLLNALHAPPCVRVSLAHYNTPQEIEAFLTALRAMHGSQPVTAAGTTEPGRRGNLTPRP